jgi:hypothetical protein
MSQDFTREIALNQLISLYFSISVNRIETCVDETLTRRGQA